MGLLQGPLSLEFVMRFKHALLGNNLPAQPPLRIYLEFVKIVIKYTSASTSIYGAEWKINLTS